MKLSTPHVGIPIIGSDLFLSDNDTKLNRMRAMYGKTHNIEAIKGTNVDMSKLEKNQSVCWGDGETYHFRLTEL
jgi:hypothetical protein